MTTKPTMISVGFCLFGASASHLDAYTLRPLATRGFGFPEVGFMSTYPRIVGLLPPVPLASSPFPVADGLFQPAQSRDVDSAYEVVEDPYVTSYPLHFGYTNEPSDEDLYNAVAPLEASAYVDNQSAFGSVPAIEDMVVMKHVEPMSTTAATATTKPVSITVDSVAPPTTPLTAEQEVVPDEEPQVVSELKGEASAEDSSESEELSAASQEISTESEELSSGSAENSAESKELSSGASENSAEAQESSPASESTITPMVTPRFEELDEEQPQLSGASLFSSDMAMVVGMLALGGTGYVAYKRKQQTGECKISERLEVEFGDDGEVTIV